VRFRARRDSDFIQNRDLYAWYNYTTRLMDLDKDGNLDIIQGGLRINTLGTGTSVTALGVDIDGNVVSGLTSGDNIYNIDGTLESDRVVNVSGFSLTLSGEAQNVLRVVGSGDTQPIFKVDGSSGE
jgi:uncharacterized protein YuzB (UPF0349 family)